MYLIFFTAGPSARDLARMFPTPPSPPQCNIASPMMQGSETVLPADTIIHDTRHHHYHHHYHHPVVSNVGTITDQPSPIAAAVLILRKVVIVKTIYSLIFVSLWQVLVSNRVLGLKLALFLSAGRFGRKLASQTVHASLFMTSC